MWERNTIIIISNSLSDRPLCRMAYLDATKNRSLRTSMALCSPNYIRRRFSWVTHLCDAVARDHDAICLLTWQCQDNNRESRWILACAILVAVVWLAWTILSTQLSPHYRDTTIAAANLVNATIIMIFLYLRKVYLYSKLTRQARDQDMKAHLQPTTFSQSLYGSSQKTFSTLAPVLYGNYFSLAICCSSKVSAIDLKKI